MILPPDRYTLFVESFDSVRSGAVDDTAASASTHLVQAQLEALSALLMGRKLSVANTYAFDSASFLEFAKVILDIWDGTLQHVPPEKRRQFAPFELRVWVGQTSTAEPNLFTAAAAQLRRTDGDQKFVLSAWPDIDDQPEERREMARVIETLGQPGAKDPVLPAFLKRGRVAEQFTTFRRIRELTGGDDKKCVQHLPGRTLPEYVEAFGAQNDAALATLARTAGVSPDLAVRIRDAVARQVANKAREKSPSINNRGWVHEPEIYAGGGPIDPAVRVFVNSLYNAVLAASADALDTYLSSPPRLGWDRTLQEGNALALAWIRKRHDALHGRPVLQGVLSEVRTMAEPPSKAHMGTALSGVFATFYELRAQEESLRRAWDQSCGQLRDLAGRRAGSEYAEDLEVAWKDHLTLLRGMLPNTVKEGPAGMTIEAMLDGSSELYRLTQWPATQSAAEATPPPKADDDGPDAVPVASGQLVATAVTETVPTEG